MVADLAASFQEAVVDVLVAKTRQALMQTGMKRGRALGWLALFAAMAPLGMSISAQTVLASYSRELTAFVIGIFMHISTTILFESSDIHRFNLAKLAAIIAGTALGFASLALH